MSTTSCFSYSGRESRVRDAQGRARCSPAGANFELLGPSETMLEATVPVVAVCAVRTGSGKSQTTRAISAER